MNKFKAIVVLFLSLCLFLFSDVFARNKNLPLLSKVIYLDPG